MSLCSISALSALLPREVAYAQSRDSVRKAVARTARLLAVQTPIAGVIAISLAIVLTRHQSGAREAAIIAAVAFTALFPFRAARAICEGLQDLGFIGTAYLLAWGIGFAVTIIGVSRGLGIAALACGWAATQATDAVLCALRLWLRWRDAIPSWRLLISPTPAGERLARGFWISVSQIAQVLIYGHRFGHRRPTLRRRRHRAVQLHGQTDQRPGQSAAAHYARGGTRAQPEMRMAESRTRLANVTNALSLAMLLASGLVVTVCLAVNPGFVHWWVGGKYFSGFGLTLLFSLSMVLRHLNVTAIYTLFAFGHEKLLALTSLADGFLSTVLSLVFATLLHSLAGVVLGSIASTCCVLVFANGRKLSEELGVGYSELCKPLAGWFLAHAARRMRRLPAQRTWTTEQFPDARLDQLYRRRRLRGTHVTRCAAIVARALPATFSQPPAMAYGSRCSRGDRSMTATAPRLLRARRRAWVHRPATVFFAFTAAYLVTWAGHMNSGDSAFRIAWAKAMLFQHTARIDSFASAQATANTRSVTRSSRCLFCSLPIWCGTLQVSARRARSTCCSSC